MPCVEYNSMMEVSEVMIKAESSLINKHQNKSYIEHRSTHRYLGDLLHNDRHMSHFKISTCSTNPLSK